MIDTVPDDGSLEEPDTLDAFDPLEPGDPAHTTVDDELRQARTDEELGVEGQRLRARLRARMFGIDAAPLKIGRYTVLDTLGAGGMGVVYAAYDEVLDRRVAVKLLQRSDGDDGPGGERLLREAQALARLSHPHVVQIYEVGRFDRRVFLAMEFLPGPTLQRWRAEQAPGWREILDKYVQAGEGLAAAHAQGVIHRDIKPANLLLGADGRVRVVDFGLARGLGPGEPTPPERATSPLDVAITQTGDVMGTPAYMSPEQIRIAPVDARSDQFSFCVALYEALFGVRPFSGESAADVMLAINEGRVREPPRGSGVPAPVVRAVMRGLAVAREDRFVDMRGLLEQLRDPLRGRRRRIVWASAAGGAVLLLWLAMRGGAAAPGCPDFTDDLAGAWTDERHAATLGAFEATELPYATTVATHVTARLDGWAKAWSRDRKAVCEATMVRREQSDALHDARAQCLARQRDVVGAIADALARADATVVDHALAGLGDLPDPDDCVSLDPSRDAPPASVDDPQWQRGRRHVDEAIALLAAGRPEPAEAAAAQGLQAATAVGDAALEVDALVARGRARRAHEDHRAALEDFTSAIDRAEASRLDRAAAQAWILRTKLEAWIGDAEAARADGRRAAAAVARVGEPEALVVDLEIALGEAAVSAGDGDDALAHFEAASRRAGDADDLVVAEIGVGIGRAHELRGEVDATLAAYEGVRARRSRVLGEGHPLVGHDAYRIGQVHFAAGQLDEARAPLESAAAIYEARGGALEPWAVRAHTVLVLVARGRGDAEGALRHAQAAARIAASRLPGDPDRITAQSLAAEELSMHGRWEDARVHWSALAELDDAALADLADDARAAVVVAGINAGMAEARLGRREAALAEIQRGRTRAERIDDPGQRAHAIASAWQAQSVVQLELGDAAGARQAAQRGRTALGGVEAPNLEARLDLAQAEALEAIDPTDAEATRLRARAEATLAALGGVWPQRIGVTGAAATGSG